MGGKQQCVVAGAIVEHGKPGTKRGNAVIVKYGVQFGKGKLHGMVNNVAAEQCLFAFALESYLDVSGRVSSGCGFPWSSPFSCIRLRTPGAACLFPHVDAGAGSLAWLKEC